MNLDELQAAVVGFAHKLREAAKHPENRHELIEASHAYAKTLEELQTCCDHTDVKTEVVETRSFPFVAVMRSCLYCGKDSR
jgi:hypothetical protein